MNQERLMNQEIDNEEITIDLTELFMALWSRLHIILMTGVLGALIAFVDVYKRQDQGDRKPSGASGRKPECPFIGYW